MGGSADDTTTAPSAGGLGQGGREARVGAAVLAASEVLAVTDAAVLLEATENNGSPASVAGRGIGEPAEGPTHQVGEQTKLLIRGPIPTTSIHPAQATRWGCLACSQHGAAMQGWPFAYIHCWLEHLRLQGLLDRGVVPPLPQVRLLDLHIQLCHNCDWSACWTGALAMLPL